MTDILLINPNTTASITDLVLKTAKRFAAKGTNLRAVSGAFGPRYIASRVGYAIAGHAAVDAFANDRDEFDGIALACFGDPGLYAAREISPVPVVGIAEAAMLLACTVAHSFSIVTVLPRIRPMFESMVRLHGLEHRCASIRTTPLTVLDCERDPAAAGREIVKASQLAIDEDGAEAICLGCAGMGPLDKTVEEEVGVPVLDGVACAVKLLEGMHDYGLSTSRIAAFKEPEAKEHLAREA